MIDKLPSDTSSWLEYAECGNPFAQHVKLWTPTLVLFAALREISKHAQLWWMPITDEALISASLLVALFWCFFAAIFRGTKNLHNILGGATTKTPRATMKAESQRCAGSMPLRSAQMNNGRSGGTNN